MGMKRPKDRKSSPNITSSERCQIVLQSPSMKTQKCKMTPCSNESDKSCSVTSRDNSQTKERKQYNKEYNKEIQNIHLEKMLILKDNKKTNDKCMQSVDS